MEVVNEGLFDRSAKHEVNKSFYDMAFKILDNVDKFKNVPQYRLVNKNKKLKESKKLFSFYR